MSSTDLVIISSKVRISGTSNNLQLTAPELLNGTYELTNFTLINSLYNVVAGENDKIYFTHTVDGILVATLTPGNYTSTTLVVEIAAQMDAASTANYTVAYSANTGKITFTPSSSTFGFTFATNTTATARYLLGKDAVDDVAASSIVSENVIDLKLHDFIAIKIAQDNNTHVTLPDGTECSFIIPIGNASFGSVIGYTRNGNFGQFIKFNNVNTLDIEMFAADGDTLDLNGLEWSMGVKKLY